MAWWEGEAFSPEHEDASPLQEPNSPPMITGRFCCRENNMSRIVRGMLRENNSCFIWLGPQLQATNPGKGCLWRRLGPSGRHVYLVIS